jgi:NAD(P)-dependent dehydrogenase (short-subunit alcohol dehydrogenase family)
MNRAKRRQTADLSGRVALVTGGRVGIGYQVALKLLRAGARVEATTRFPCDAALRYGREEDFADWRSRLRIHGLDLRDLKAAQSLAREVEVEAGSLDVLINNAAQTVRRPPAFYAHLLPAEQQGPDALPGPLASLVCPRQYHEGAGRLAAHALPGLPDALTPTHPKVHSATASGSALFPLVPLLPGDESLNADLFPPGELDREGQQLDLRPANSWTARLGEVPLLELAEVHLVNAFAPFLLLKSLLPALRRSPHARRFVVNVSSREGRFGRTGAEGLHPHTNMAKASLNMLTRSVAPELAAGGIFVVSVDPGWVSEQRPLGSLAQGEAWRSGPTLDAADGAARVLDPVFTGLDESAAPLFGVLLKDYQVVNW